MVLQRVEMAAFWKHLNLIQSASPRQYTGIYEERKHITLRRKTNQTNFFFKGAFVAVTSWVSFSLLTFEVWHETKKASHRNVVGASHRGPPDHKISLDLIRSSWCAQEVFICQPTIVIYILKKKLLVYMNSVNIKEWLIFLTMFN